MVLNTDEIKTAQAKGELVIQPYPKPEQYQNTTSVDLTLGDVFYEWNIKKLEESLGQAPSINLENYSFEKFAEEYLKEAPTNRDGNRILGPGDLLLSMTKEELSFPPNLCGRVEGRSSLARLGLSIHYAPTIHAKFSGPITLELYNNGSLPLVLVPGFRVCQLVIETVKAINKGGGSQFHRQTSPRGRE